MKPQAFVSMSKQRPSKTASSGSLEDKTRLFEGQYERAGIKHYESWNAYANQALTNYNKRGGVNYSYPILTFEEVQPIDIVLINRPGEPFLGIGEAAQGPTAAALGNAIFDATGVRFRRIPFTPKRIFAGLKA